MTFSRRLFSHGATAAALLTCALALTVGYMAGQSTVGTAPAAAELQTSFAGVVKPFFAKRCAGCHNADLNTAGIRVDELNATLEERQLPVWDAIRRRLQEGTMPPKGMPQPSAEERQQMVEWIGHALDYARVRPVAKNGSVRRLTVSQYRNSLRELLGIEDDLTGALPPDAVSKDGFLNNRDSLQLSPTLTEAYFEIADEALSRVIIDPKAKPAIQNFRVDLGAGVNPDPIPEKLILGDHSALLNNDELLVTQLTAKKPFAFEPFFMKTNYRFIEGYQGNDTVRGWRDFKSIYHAVFADMRGTMGYPKGEAFSAVPEGLLLRPAIPSDENFGVDGTFGPRANFKISLRELPDEGRFRVTVTAAKYDDGLLLDGGAEPRQSALSVVARDPKVHRTVEIAKPGIYQVDVYPQEPAGAAADGARLNEGLAGRWPLSEESPELTMTGGAKFVESPFGKAVSLSAESDAVTIAGGGKANTTDGDFTIAAWVHPTQLRKAGVLARGAEGAQGWYLDMPDARGSLRFASAGPGGRGNGSLVSPAGALRANTWQHVAVVVRRAKAGDRLNKESRLYLNGYVVAHGSVGPLNIDDAGLALTLGRAGAAPGFKGEVNDLRIYRRALGEPELQALLEPGKQFVQAPVFQRFGGGAPGRRAPDMVTVNLGTRQLSGAVQTAFAVVRLSAGPLEVSASPGGLRDLDRLVLTPLPETAAPAKLFTAFERRTPRVGVHLGFRRDCGSTFSPVGSPQTVTGDKAARYVFEGTLRNFPAPQVEKDNVNYLAGMHEIGVRSEYTDGRDMPRLLVKSVEFEGPYYDSWPPAPYRAIFGSGESRGETAASARKIVRDFATRAWRRPVTAAEEAMLLGVFEKSIAGGSDFRAGIKDALLVVLTAPQFLFLTETSKSPAPEPLDGYEMASKLSYFLWNGPPDRTLLRLASAGTLTGQLNAEVTRMIEDPKFGRFASEFASQWLNLDKFQVVEIDKKKFPTLTLNARSQLKQEPVEFLKYLIVHNLPVRNLVESDFVVANETVAGYYGLGDKTESGFAFVPVVHGRPDLGGLLTEPALLSGLSDGRESNPVKRGAWLARKIIAEPPNDPPPNVPALKESTKDLTLRQRLEQHRTQPACNQCHSKIDPWGVPFEQYDAGGRLKSGTVDAKSTLPDKTEVGGVNDLRRYLAEDRLDQVAFSFLKHLETYAIGRSLTYTELNYLRQDELKMKAGGYRMRDLVGYVVESKLFLEK